jgi:hypothetical protein
MIWGVGPHCVTIALQEANIFGVVRFLLLVLETEL